MIYKRQNNFNRWIWITIGAIIVVFFLFRIFGASSSGRSFGSDKIAGIMNRLGIEEGEHIESKMVTRAVENAQKKVETMHFESRKHLLEYDDVANEQRKVIYNFRNDLLL